LALVDDLSIWQNLYLDREITWGFGPVHFLNRSVMQKEAQRLLNGLNVSVPSILARVRRLSGGQRQAVAIARGVMWGTELLLMDEPTAALGVRETEKVESLIVDLVKRGLGLIVISHNLDQVMRISQRIWVMRNGRVVGGLRTADATREEIVSMITGLSQQAQTSQGLTNA
jgi:D-xylose transport system ATP-binding protein